MGGVVQYRIGGHELFARHARLEDVEIVLTRSWSGSTSD